MDIISSIVCFLFGSLFWLAFAYTLLTHLLLWQEKRLTNSLQPTKLLISGLIELVCLFANLILLPIGFRKSSPQFTQNPQTPAPILLIHGYMNTPSVWLWFKRQLAKHPGIGPIYTINLFPMTASIEKLAHEVQKTLDNIKTETQAEKVFLIGHSMGGVVASYCAEHLTPNQVEGVITLGTPFQGTRQATFGFGQSVQAVFPNSGFCQALKAAAEKSTLPYYTVASQLDNLILPWESATLELPSDRTLTLENYGHLRLVISPTVVEQVLNWIRPQ